MRALIGLILAVLIGFLVYRFYFSVLPTASPGTTATQSISLVGVKNDLNAIAQAERVHMAQFGGYATLDELIEKGLLSVSTRSREGYTYEVQAGDNTFTVTARHTGGTGQVRWPTLVIDQTMEIREQD